MSYKKIPLFIFAVTALMLFQNCKKNSDKKVIQIKKQQDNRTEKYALIKKTFLEKGKKYIEIDSIQFFTGEKAVKAFKEDNDNKIFEGGFYIRNLNEILDTIEVLDSVKIKMQTFDYQPDGNFDFNKGISFKIFRELFGKREYSHFKQIPFKITLINNRISMIKEVYIP